MKQRLVLDRVSKSLTFYVRLAYRLQQDGIADFVNPVIRDHETLAGRNVNINRRTSVPFVVDVSRIYQYCIHRDPEP